MTFSKTTVAKAKGVGAAIAKRGLLFGMGILVVQLFSLQFSVSNGAVEQQKHAQERLQQALRENKSEHQKTQRYVKCLVAIVLVPLEDRPDDPQKALDKCGDEPQSAQVSSTKAVPAQSQPMTTKTNQPTTSAPPEQPARQQASRQRTSPPNPLVQPVINFLNAINPLKGGGL